MSSPSPSELMRVAVAAARHGGGYALDNFARRHEVNQRTHHDVKLQLDVETQQQVEAFLADAYPQHSLFGEEAGEMDTEAEFVWVIDPIDGTMNFMQGLPHWCCSVAVMQRGKVVAGAVYSPRLDECFYASRDDAALCNGEAIHVSPVEHLRDAFVCTAGLSRTVATAAGWEGFRALLEETGKVRVLGAAALDLCYVACGRMDAMYEYGLKIWDVAAAGLIMQQAGGTFETFGTGNDYLCTNGPLRDPLKAMLQI